MVKKIWVVVGIILLPGVLFAQLRGIGELKIQYNEFSVDCNFINMKPINDYLATYGFPPLGDISLLFAYASKGKAGEKLSVGMRFGTTLAWFEPLAPNFLKREIYSVSGKNKAEMSITMFELLFEYEFLKFGGFSVSAGAGLGLGGTKLSIFGETNSGKFWLVSFLLKPQARASYHFFEETGMSFILSLNAAYNYLPVTGWNFEAGSLPCPPGPGSNTPFDLSGASVGLSITFPIVTK